MIKFRVLQSDVCFAAVVVWMLVSFIAGIAIGVSVGLSNATYQVLGAVAVGPFLIVVWVDLIRLWIGTFAARRSGE